MFITYFVITALGLIFTKPLLKVFDFRFKGETLITAIIITIKYGTYSMV
ncbi:MAG: hypothetical protein RSD77_06545 [Romboutsia sp.]